jgi:hypothetical protein
MDRDNRDEGFNLPGEPKADLRFVAHLYCCLRWLCAKRPVFRSVEQAVESDHHCLLAPLEGHVYIRRQQRIASAVA